MLRRNVAEPELRDRWPANAVRQGRRWSLRAPPRLADRRWPTGGQMAAGRAWAAHTTCVAPCHGLRLSPPKRGATPRGWCSTWRSRHRKAGGRLEAATPGWRPAVLEAPSYRTGARVCTACRWPRCGSSIFPRSARTRAPALRKKTEPGLWLDALRALSRPGMPRIRGA